MAKPDQEAIETFVSITGASHSLAAETLQAHEGDLYQAVDAHLNRRVENSARVAPTISGPDLSSSTPFVSDPKEAREIPIEVKDSGEGSGHSGLVPKIEGVTGTDDEVVPNTRAGLTDALNEERHEVVTDLSALRVDGWTDYDDDVEEEMVRAAIKASKREVGEVLYEDGWGSSDTQPWKSHLEDPDLFSGQEEDPDLAYAVSLSLKTAEQEKAFRELGGSSEIEANKSTDDEYLAFFQADKEKEDAQRLYWEAAEKVRKEEKTRRRYAEYEEMSRQLEAKEAALPPEPKFGVENVVSILVKVSTSSRLRRRFLKSDKLQYLFDFIDASGSVVPGTYNLVKSYSDGILSLEQSNLSLEEVGLTNKKETLHLEKIRNVFIHSE